MANILEVLESYIEKKKTQISEEKEYLDGKYKYFKPLEKKGFKVELTEDLVEIHCSNCCTVLISVSKNGDIKLFNYRKITLEVAHEILASTILENENKSE